MGHPRTVTAEEILGESAWMLRLARSLVVDPSAAEDIAQETCVAALSRPPQRGMPLRAWLRQVLHNIASKWRRREGTRLRHEARHRETSEWTTPSAAELAETADLVKIVVSELDHLATPLRTTLVMRYVHDMTSAEIAKTMKVPAGTVRWRLKKGLDELRERLDERHRGQREAWQACLAILVVPPAGASATGFRIPTASVPGKMALTAVAVVGVGLATWNAWPRQDLRIDDLQTTSVDGAGATNGTRESALARRTAPADRGSSGRRVIAASNQRAGPLRIDPGQAAALVQVSASDGRPLRGANVRLQSLQNAFSNTGPDGRALVLVRPPASPMEASLLVECPGYAAVIMSVVMRVGEVIEMPELRLTRSREVAGTVRGQDGTLRPGALVFVQPPGLTRFEYDLRLLGPGPWRRFHVPAVKSDERGRYHLPCVPAVPLRVFAVAEDTFFTWSGVVPSKLVDGNTIDLALERLPDVMFIDGKVLGPDGEPMRATVRLTWQVERSLKGARPRDLLTRFLRGPTYFKTDVRGRIRLPSRAGTLYELVVQGEGDEFLEAKQRGVPSGQKGLLFRLQR